MSEAKPPSLDVLRQEIDKIDDKLHALLRARAEVVTLVAAAKAATAGDAPAPAFRPGREADVLRALAARHDGPFGLPSLVRIWREIISGMTRIQQDIVVAAYRPEKGDTDGWDLARDHFGLGMRYLPMRRSRDVVSAVRDGRAGIGVVPAPGGEDGEEPWWPLLAADSGDLPRIALKLPFLRPAGAAPAREHAVIAMPGPEPEGVDVDYLAIEPAAGASRDRIADALKAAGVDVATLLNAGGLYLAEARAGWPADIDGAVIRHVTQIGGYPTPIGAP